MKILDIIHNPTTVDIIVEVDNKTWESTVHSLIQARAKNVKIQGFRTGKVPFEIANKYVNRLNVYESAINKLIESLIKDVENDTKFKKDDSVIIGAPMIEFKEVDDNHCILILKYELEPILTIPDYKKIKFEGLKKLEVSEKDIDNEIQKILENDQKIKAMNAGSKDKNNEIKNELPKLTDSLVASWNIDKVKTVKELKDWLKNQMLETIKLDNREIAGKQISAYLLEKTTINYIPNSYLNEQMRTQINALNQKLAHEKITKEQYLKMSGMNEEMLYERLRQDAKNAVIVALAMESIVKKEKIEVKEKQIKDYINKLAKLYNLDVEKFEKSLSEKEKEIIQISLLNNNVIDKLIELNTK